VPTPTPVSTMRDKFDGPVNNVGNWWMGAGLTEVEAKPPGIGLGAVAEDCVAEFGFGLSEGRKY
jgi:hypothetical protein